MDKWFDEWEFSPFGISVFYMSRDIFANIHFVIKIMHEKNLLMLNILQMNWTYAVSLLILPKTPLAP
jgi:hypothetical protein